MRTICLLLLVAVISASGCAGLIARSGTDLTALKTRDDVHALFGKPVATGVVDEPVTAGPMTESIVEGKTFEDYVTRKKIAALPEEPSGRGLGSLAYPGTLLFSLGTCELVLIPEQLTLMAVRYVGGEKIRFTYDRSGKLIDVQRNSNCDYFQSDTGHIQPGISH